MTISSQNLRNTLKTDLQGSSTLSGWGLIFVEGPDAAALLQGQLSNSVLGLRSTPLGVAATGQDSVRLVGYCTPKGRLLASAWLSACSSNEEVRFALFISKDIAASTAKRLSMFVLRSKAKVTDVSDSWIISGIYSADEGVQVGEISKIAIALELPPVLLEGHATQRVLVATPKSNVDASSESAPDPNALMQWNYLEVMSAIPRIVLATQEQFVPQMINFESVAGVDFKKGCYPGQEIVARSQYRGAVKRRLQLSVASMAIDAALCQPGAELFHSGDPTQPCGMVVLCAENPQHAGQLVLQIECKLDALEDGEIHLGAIAGPLLQILQLPYSLIEI